MLEQIKKQYKKETIKIAIGWTLTSIMVVLFISFTIIMIEYAIPSKDINLIIKLGIIYLGVNILRAIVTFFEDLNTDAFTTKIQADYREKIFVKLPKMNQNEIDKIRVGEILENMLNDTKEFSKFYGIGICMSYYGGVIRLLGTLAVLAYLNIPIVTITFIIYLIGFGITYLFNKRSIKYTKAKRMINAKILNWSNEQVQGYQTIKSLEIEQKRMKEIKSLLKVYEDSVNKLEKNIRSYTCIYDFIVSFVGVTNILLGSISIENGIISYGALVILSRYISSPETYAKWFIEGFQIRNIGKIAYNKITNILQKAEEDIDTGIELSKVDKIEFKNVNFTYNDHDKALDNISFTANKNEKIALVGRTGSGKTSLVNVICRFYDAQSGKITINDKDYKEYSIKSLRNKIGYIMQKVVIFNGTIFDNINYANKDISKQELIDICKKLNLHNKIMSLKDEYNTIINEDTDLFSAGEKQLINFARVMVENPEIIILDEATASLSYKSEMLVRQAIEEITKGKISFIIAHRLSTIKNCDKIFLMDNGSIIEQGDHNELIEKQGKYYELLNA